jgi:hypothetical protein
MKISLSPKSRARLGSRRFVLACNLVLGFGNLLRALIAYHRHRAAFPFLVISALLYLFLALVAWRRFSTVRSEHVELFAEGT